MAEDADDTKSKFVFDEASRFEFWRDSFDVIEIDLWISFISIKSCIIIDEKDSVDESSSLSMSCISMDWKRFVRAIDSLNWGSIESGNK